MRVIRQIVGFVVAVAVTAVGSSFLSSHFVLRGLESLGVDVEFADRFAMYAHDVAGMSLMAGAVAGTGLLIALSVAALIVRFLPSLRTLGYVLAGTAAMVGALLAMQSVLGMMPMAGARTWGGLAAQGVAGALGGYVFARITLRRERP